VSERGIPTAAELAQALREFLLDEVMPQADGALAFQARVAGNVAAIIERELRLGPAHARAHHARLTALGMRDDAQLARAIRDGELDARVDELRTALLATAIEELLIDNPRHLEPRHRDGV
jgi:autotransporter translocation and assembly factor TamB